MSGPLQDLQSLQLEIRELIHDQLRLISLEVRLAAQNLMAMIATAVCVGVLMLMAWAGLMAAITLVLVRLGLDSALALLTVTALTSALALILGMRIRRWSSRLGLPATLRALKPQTTAMEAGEAK